MTSIDAVPAEHDLLPAAEPISLLDPTGRRLHHDHNQAPPPDTLRALYRRMVIGRRFDAQATALTRQGRLAVYPSALGQEACEIGAVMALGDQDWLFPTYRDTMALITRDIDPVRALTLLRGDWHCGYDPHEVRTAPQCTPLATNAPHAVGLADAARRKGEHLAVLAMLGDGATSEGDTHEALNFAAVFGSPVVFFVQNNGWAISVPLSKQTKAPSLAHKAIGYGMPGIRVDGNDVAAVHAVLGRALAAARAGGGPVLVEGVTYRMAAHTNADDAGRYRDDADTTAWRERDPIDRVETLLRAEGALDDDAVAGVADEAERFAAALRERMSQPPHPEAAELRRHTYGTRHGAYRGDEHRDGASTRDTGPGGSGGTVTREGEGDV